jgi:hypothetical protein
VADFLQEKRKEIEDRLRELRPLVAEYQKLEEAAAALAGVSTEPKSANGARAASSGGTTTTTRRRRRAKSTGTGRRGRPPGSGKRAQQALKLVAAQPGISIPDLAKAMKIQPNYLYRVMPTLEKDGKIKKKDKGWHPAA